MVKLHDYTNMTTIIVFALLTVLFSAHVNCEKKQVYEPQFEYLYRAVESLVNRENEIENIRPAFSGGNERIAELTGMLEDRIPSTMILSELIILGIYVVMVSSIYGQTMDDVYKLHQDLLKNANYSKHVRPAVDQTTPTIVNISFDIISIREIDEITGKLSIVGIIWMVWKDPRLVWNPADYGNAMDTKLEMKEVWKPDLVIGHPIESVTAVGFDHYHYPVRYSANGVALWAPVDVMTTTCKIDVAYYPFDTQMCEVMFIPWGSRINEIYLSASKKEISTKYFVRHGEWELTESIAREGRIDVIYPSYNIVLELRRRPTFIMVNVVIPILLMTVLNVLVFFFPAQSGERISFSMTVLLAIAVFLTLVGDNMPKTSEPMSTICYFLLSNLVLSSVIMIITILNLNIFHRSDLCPVSGWLVNVVVLLRCKRTRRTKVEDVSVYEHDVPETAINEGNEKSIIRSKWVTSETDDGNKVTWKDVSRTFDKIFGMLAFVWLLFSAAAFIGIVSTQTVPGVEE